MWRSLTRPFFPPVYAEPPARGSSSACEVGHSSPSEEEGELVAQPALEPRACSRRWLAALRAGDVGLEQPLLEQRGSLWAPGHHHDLRVAVERPGVEVDGAEADDVVGDDDLGVHDGGGELPHLDACRE